MEFQTVAIVKHPRPMVWATMRDCLVEIAAHISDIESVTAESKHAQPDGTWVLVNLWKARPQLPALVLARLKPEMFVWTDCSTWIEHDYMCDWRIKMHWFGDHLDCRGTTRYEPAMGGRGTRITFQGQLSIRDGPGIALPLEGVMIKTIESVLQTLIPKNFQKLVSALAGVLGADVDAAAPVGNYSPLSRSDEISHP